MNRRHIGYYLAAIDDLPMPVNVDPQPWDFAYAEVYARLKALANTERAGSWSDYQIALRNDDLGLDDVVVNDVEMFRMERMDADYVWLACHLADGQEIVFDLYIADGVIVYKAREPLPNVTYEARP